MSDNGPSKLACRLFDESLTPWLTGAGARSAEGTDIGHENAEGMAYVGVRVEPPVRLGGVGRAVADHRSLGYSRSLRASVTLARRGESLGSLAFKAFRFPRA